MRVQRPSTEANWLYKDIDAKNRWFTKEVCLSNSASNLPECTNEEKEQWEHDHQPEQPEQPQEAEVVNE